MHTKMYVELTISQTRSRTIPAFRKERHTSPGGPCYCNSSRGLCFNTFEWVILLYFHQDEKCLVLETRKTLWCAQLDCVWLKHASKPTIIQVLSECLDHIHGKFLCLISSVTFYNKIYFHLGKKSLLYRHLVGHWLQWLIQICLTSQLQTEVKITFFPNCFFLSGNISFSSSVPVIFIDFGTFLKKYI